MATRLIPAALAGTLLFAACGGGSASNTASETPLPAAAEPEVVATEAPAADEPADAAPATETQPAAVDEATAADSAAAEPDAVEATPAVVPASLQFSAPLVGGGELDATTLAGKPTVFWFWAPN